MEVIRFDAIKDSLINNLRRQSLIPVIGSGFTSGCKSFKGKVPSGKEYKTYMINQISDCLSLSDHDKEELMKNKFSAISSHYHKYVRQDIQIQYLTDNFSRVSLGDSKKDFLSINWPYIYTLNMDDAIERNSNFNFVINPNREVRDIAFDNNLCVVKLHGDVADVIKYSDSESEIFSEEQYIISLSKNTNLLSRIRHDGIFLNIVFIGCSLDDEIDLLYSLMPYDGNAAKTARYYCGVKEPSIIEKLNYEKFGITHFIVFDSFDDIYKNLYECSERALELSADDLENYKRFSTVKLPSEYDDNKPYLFQGKGLIEKNHKITIPYFFISRTISTGIINKLTNYPIQFIIGSGFSGRSYLLIDIACRIRDRDVFVFESKDKISNNALDTLLNKKDCLILADDHSLTSSQIEVILRRKSQIKSNNNNIIIFAAKNDRDLHGVISLFDQLGIINLDEIPTVELSNKFSSLETNEINPLLAASNFGIFTDRKTILDNIIDSSVGLAERNRFFGITPKFSTTREISALISLATERKIYSKKATVLELWDELALQKKYTFPLIDSEETWSFERSAGDESPIKFVTNAEYWLCDQLQDFAGKIENHQAIANAYTYIISKLIACYGKPDIMNSNKTAEYREYIMFDTINRIFSGTRKGSLSLIRKIYEQTNELLSSDPNYMHQRSKCYIQSSYHESNISKKREYIEKAYRDANVATSVFAKRLERRYNDKIQISLDHAVYTKALIMCHKCRINNYSSIAENNAATRLLHDALVGAQVNNSYQYAVKDKFNRGQVIENTITKLISDSSLVDDEVTPLLSDLFAKISVSNGRS